MAMFSQDDVAPYKRGQIARSFDKGRTWEIGPTLEESNAGFAVMTLFNFGQDYDGERDDFVYVYAGRTLDGCIDRCLGKEHFHARMASKRVFERSAYEFLSGFDSGGRPGWSDDIATRQPILRTSMEHRSGVVFSAGLEKYILSNSHDNHGGLGIFVTEAPWGPWETLAYDDNWLGFGCSPSYHVAPQKWMSEDGTEFTMVFPPTTAGIPCVDGLCSVAAMSVTSPVTKTGKQTSNVATTNNTEKSGSTATCRSI